MKPSANPLREHRQRAGVTLDELAKLVCTSKTTLSQIENGKRPISLNLLPKIAAALRVPPKKLRPDLAELLKQSAA